MQDENSENTPRRTSSDQKESTDPCAQESVILTPRDIGVFKLAHEHRYVAYNQLRRAFWNERSVTAKACYKRIEELVNAGYLRKERAIRKKNLHIYFATEKSHHELKARGLDSGLELYKPTEYYDRHIDHDLKVLTLRVFFRELGFDRWTSERVLKERDHLKRIPDGRLTVNGKHIAIEFENNITKSMARYSEMFRYYTDNEDYFLVWIIVYGDVKDWFVRVLDYDVRQVWITTYKELLKKKREALFENKEETFVLKDLL